MDSIKKFFDGKKTILGAIGVILAALGYFLTTGLADGFQFSDIITLIRQASEGLIALGLGNKLFKLTAAIDEKK